MKEVQRTIYIAEDGKEFTSKLSCESHEKSIKEGRKIAQKYNDIIDFCSAHYSERDDGDYIWCENDYCPLYSCDSSHHCRLDCIPCIDMVKIGTE